MPCLVPRCSSSAATMATSKKGNRIYVYTGKGAGIRSVNSAARSISASLPLADVRTLSAAALLEGSWSSSALALVMPGGADLPYCADLNGRGNELIRSFVEEQGGSFLGFCAGAYYASSRVEFEVGSRKLRVEGDRELALFPGVALGAVVPGFRYETEAGAAATKLRWRTAREVEWRECLDYCNGGPVFVLRGGSGSGSSGGEEAAGRVPDKCEVAGVAVEVLARYHREEDAASSSPSSSPAVAAAAEGGAAALRCRVGKGVAVLCGTHPELRPARAWLLLAPAAEDGEAAEEEDHGGGGGGGKEGKEEENAAGGAATEALAAEGKTVSELVSGLDDPAASAERERYWESLLDAAGLGGLKV